MADSTTRSKSVHGWGRIFAARPTRPQLSLLVSILVMALSIVVVSNNSREGN